MEVRVIHRNILDEMKGIEPRVEQLFAYDRGELAFDKLKDGTEAKRLHSDVVRELN